MQASGSAARDRGRCVLRPVRRGGSLPPAPRRLRRALRGRGGEPRFGVLASHDGLHELVEHLVEARGRVAQLHATGECGVGGTAQPPRVVRHLPLGQLDDRDRAAHGRAAADARVHSRPPRQSHRGAHQRGVAAPGRRRDDRFFLGSALIVQSQMLETVADGLGQMAGGHVLRRVLRGHHLESLGRAHLPQVRHLHDALVERGEQQVLRRLRQPVQLVQEEDPPLAHGPQQRPRDERLLVVAEPEHQRRVEPAGQATLREAVVAVDADGRAPEFPADGQRQGRLARPHGSFEEQVAAADEGRARRRHLLHPSDHVADASTSRGQEAPGMSQTQSLSRILAQYRTSGQRPPCRSPCSPD